MISSDYIVKARQKEDSYQNDRREENLHTLMLALMRCAEEHFCLKEFEDAKNAYIKATEYAEESEYLQTSVQIQRDLSECYLKMGDSCREQHENAAAGTFYEKAMLLRERVMGQTGTLADRRVYCMCCEKAAGAFDSQDRPDDAKRCLEKSLTVRKQIAGEAPKDYDRRMLAAVYDCLGIHYELRKDRKAANDYYKEGLRLCQQLVSASDTYQNRELLAYAYYNAASTSDQNLERRTFFRKTYELFEQLNAENPQREKYRKALAVIRAQLRLRSMVDE